MENSWERQGSSRLRDYNSFPKFIIKWLNANIGKVNIHLCDTEVFASYCLLQGQNCHAFFKTINYFSLSVKASNPQEHFCWYSVKLPLTAFWQLRNLLSRSKDTLISISPKQNHFHSISTFLLPFLQDSLLKSLPLNLIQNQSMDGSNGKQDVSGQHSDSELKFQQTYLVLTVFV